MPSPLLHVVNACATPILYGGHGPRHPEAATARMIERAAQDAGTERPDPNDPVIEGFTYLVEQFAAVAGLSPIGWMSVRADLQNRLSNWLRVQRLHTEHPEIAEEDVSDPVVVVGLPRTATTLVHHLLAAADGHRGTRLWELLHTDLPLPDAEAAKIIAGVEQGQRMIRMLIPEMIDIHPQAATKSDEDAFLVFHGPQHQARALMPEYKAWEEARDASGDYTYLKQVLQVLQHGRKPSRWVLKNPIHLAHLPELLAVFPKAKIVWMHRDPATVMGSICSLVETSHRLHLRRIDLAAIGRECLDMLQRLIERGRDARTLIPPGSLIDVPYDWLTAAPYSSVPELYKLIGATWTHRDDAGLEAILARPSRARKHDYAVPHYGLDELEIDRAFGDYGHLVHALATGPRSN